MSLTETGLDLDALWARKIETINATRGLSCWLGGETFADIVGLDSIKAKLRQRMKSKTPIGVVVWIDEIDKSLGNVESDLGNNVRSDQLKTFLVKFENSGWRGAVGVGVGGGGKSLIAKAFGNEAGVLTIALDLGAIQSSLVGESEANIRRAFDVIEAVGRGNAYFIATSNAASVMRPELQRRFTDGFWFFDLMTKTERDAAWKFYIAKYELSAAQTKVKVDDDGWTGAEIRNCCRDAWDSGCTLAEAAQFIVAMSRSRADEIERLRTNAHGRYLDAAKPGVYHYDAEPMKKSVRAIELPKANGGSR